MLSDSRPREDSEPEKSKIFSEGVSAGAAAVGEQADDKLKHAMKKLMSAVKMIVMLKEKLDPLKQKLTLVLEHMSPEDAKKAKGILHHIKVIDIYSQVTKGLMAGVIIAGCLTQGG